MEEQTLRVFVPSVAEELAALLTENNFASDADQVRDSFTPTALTDYCHAFFKSRVDTRAGLNTFQGARNFLRFRAEDKLIEEMKVILAKHDLELEYFKTKVINSLGRMGRVGEILVARAEGELLSPFVSSADFITLISQIINEHGEGDESNRALEEAVRQLAERFKPELLAVEEKKDGEVAAEPSIFDKIMRKFIKRKLTDEEAFERLKAIELEPGAHFDWPPAKPKPQVVVKSTMDIVYPDTVRVEILPARPQVEEQPSVEEIPAAPLFDKVWDMFNFNKKKKAEEAEVSVVTEAGSEVRDSMEPNIIVINTSSNGSPSLLSRLTTTFSTVTSAVGTAVESAVNSFGAPKSGIRLSPNEDAFISGETTRRELLERMEKLNNEVRAGSQFLADVIPQHSHHIDLQVSRKLHALSSDVVFRQEIITQLSFYETARDENNVKEKKAAVEKAAIRWWNVGFLKVLPLLSYFYEKLKVKTTDYFESSLAGEQIKMELLTGNKNGFNENAARYQTLFGDYITEERFGYFFMKNEERNRAAAELAPLENEWQEKYGEIPYKAKLLDSGSDLDDMESVVASVSSEVLAQASQDWGDLAEVAPPKGSPTLTRAIN